VQNIEVIHQREEKGQVQVVSVVRYTNNDNYFVDMHKDEYFVDPPYQDMQ
jgi:hypothetical protein